MYNIEIKTSPLYKKRGEVFKVAINKERYANFYLLNITEISVTK